MRYNLPSCICMLFAACTISNTVLAAPPDKAALLKQAEAGQLSFMENKGQVTDQYYKPRKDVDFKLGVPGMSIFVGDGQLHYQWTKDLSAPRKQTRNMEQLMAAKESREQQEYRTEFYRMDVTLIGANKHAKATKEQKQGYVENYYLSHYKGEVSSYNKITYHDVYPHIDWVLYSKGTELKYDFIVHPGGDPKQIKLQYEGATALSLKEGALTAATPMGSITEQKPYSYDAVTKEEIASSFILSENTLSFNIAANSTTHDLVIDPTLNWATYYGGNSHDYAVDVVSNSTGDAFLGGFTGSTNNIATIGAHQTTTTGTYDVFIGKLNSAGVRQWGTYFGSAENDMLNNIVLDPSGNIYLAGETHKYLTTTPSLATPGAHQTIYGGDGDAMLAKFTSSGTLVWCSYFGSFGWEWGTVACDASGNVYLAGTTMSSTNLSTPGAYQTAGATPSSYLSKWSSAGVLQWSTYYGLSTGGSTSLYAITCDLSGNVYMTGMTNQNIATPGAHQTALGSGFLSKWNTSGNLLWTTHYGGWGTDVDCDLSGNVYLSGFTTSTTNIATVGAHQSSGGGSGNADAFLAKFNSSGVRQWGTYYGGSGEDYMSEVEIAADGKIYMFGQTASTNNIATTGGYRSTILGTDDFFLVEFMPTGVRNWGTYYGGTGTEEFTLVNTYSPTGFCRGIGVSGNGKLYITGTTTSTTNISTPGAHQPAIAGMSSDAMLASWSLIPDTIAYIDQPFADTVFCPGQSFTLRYSVNNPFRTGNVFTAQLSNASGSFTSPVTVGSKADLDSGTILVTIPNTTTAGTGYRVRIISSNPAGISTDNGINIRIKPKPALTVSSPNISPCAGDTLKLSVTSTPASTSYSWTGPASFTSSAQNPYRVSATTAMSGYYPVTATLDGCTSKDSVLINVKTRPNITASAVNSAICSGDSLKLTANTSTPGTITYAWAGPLSFSSALKNPNRTSTTTAMSGYYVVTATLNGCSAKDSVLATVKTKPNVTAGAVSTTICAGDSLKLTTNTTTPGTITYGWTGPLGFSAAQQNALRTATTTAMSGYYIVTATLNGCATKDSVLATIKTKPNVLAGTFDNVVCAGGNLNLMASTSTPGTIGYTWSGPLSFTSTQKNPTRTSVTTAMSGYYIVTANLAGCTAKDSIQITIGAQPDVTAGIENNLLCTGDTMKLTATSSTPGVSYTWTGPVFFTSTQQNPLRTPLAVAMTGYHVVTATLGMCSATDSVLATVEQTPAAPLASSNSPVCVGTPLYLAAASATMGAAYEWTGPNAFYSTQQTPTISNAQLVHAGTYTVRAILGYCSSATTMVNVSVQTCPTSVNDINSKKQLQLYPNPNKGSFTISGISGSEVSLSITNITGQVVYKEVVKNVAGQLQLKTQLPKGVYLIRLINESNEQSILKFTITEE